MHLHTHLLENSTSEGRHEIIGHLELLGYLILVVKRLGKPAKKLLISTKIFFRDVDCEVYEASECSRTMGEFDITGIDRILWLLNMYENTILLNSILLRFISRCIELIKNGEKNNTECVYVSILVCERTNRLLVMQIIGPRLH